MNDFITLCLLAAFIVIGLMLLPRLMGGLGSPIIRSEVTNIRVTTTPTSRVEAVSGGARVKLRAS